MDRFGLRRAGERGVLCAPLALASVVALTSACASAPPLAPAAPPSTAPAAARIDRPLQAESEIGGLNEEAMDRAFAALGGEVQRCVEQRSHKLDALGGELRVRLRIDRSGNARWAYISESTLGDRDTEKCILESARAKTWPLPVGGDGLAEKSYAVDASKAPVVLEGKRVARDVARARAQALKCKRGLRGPFVATAYVTPDGRIASAGVAAPNENGEAASDCMVEVLRKLRFAGPGREAKVSFEI